MEDGNITVTLVSPGGTATTLDQGSCRVASSHWASTQFEDSLLQEMRNGPESIPFVSVAAKQEALASIEKCMTGGPDAWKSRGLDKEELMALFRYTNSLPCFAADQEESWLA